MFRVLRQLALLALPLLAVIPGTAAAGGPGDTGNVFLEVRVEDMDGLWAFVDEWSAAGARLPHIYPPDVVIGDVPEDLEGAIAADPRVVRIHRKPARPAGHGKAAARRNLLARSWNEERLPVGLPPSAKTIPFADGLLPHPDVESGRAPKGADGEPKTYGSAYGASFWQTSEIFLGRISVGVIMADSPGFAYSEDDVVNVLAAVRGCMDYWETEVDYLGVRFVYDIQSGVDCSYAFANNHPQRDEDLWVHEIMNGLGYYWSPKGDPWEPVYEYVDTLRTRFGTEWGTCLFIPDAPNFAGSIAYARHGGPYAVCPSGVQKEGNRLVAGSVWLSHLLIHEFAHLFWALDEYAPGSAFGTAARCDARAGYHDVVNHNSLFNGGICFVRQRVSCCMDIPGANVCGFTLGQMGLLDEDEDDIPDIADTDPYVSVDPLPDTVTTIYPVISGVAAEMAEYNHIRRNGELSPKITFNTIEHVLYRIDTTTDGEGLPLWYSADPEGGYHSADPTFVNYSFLPDSLYGGHHYVTVRAVNSVGNTTGPYYPDKTIELYVKAIALHEFEAEPDYDGRVRLSYRIRGGALGADATVYRKAGDGTEEVFRTFVLEDESREEFYDEGAIPGKAYSYRLEASALGLTWNWTTELVSPSPIRKGSYLSFATPNPFRTETVISYLVPRGFPLDQTAIDGKPDGEDALPNPNVGESPRFAGEGSVEYEITRVELDIFNVAGRLVKSFPHVHSYEGFHPDPVIWDGRDDSGRDVPPGVYFVRMKAADLKETRKIVRLR
ncbi:MAG: FlgD immunoglobulin-like domain containing protein [Candidatus Eisenbacteria bacterium]